jgi:hypothetical protein
LTNIDSELLTSLCFFDIALRVRQNLRNKSVCLGVDELDD